MHTAMHTIFWHTFLLCHTPYFKFHFVTHTAVLTVRSFTTSFPFPSFPVRATTFDAHYWKKLTCGVIRSFNYQIIAWVLLLRVGWVGCIVYELMFFFGGQYIGKGLRIFRGEQGTTPSVRVHKSRRWSNMYSSDMPVIAVGRSLHVYTNNVYLSIQHTYEHSNIGNIYTCAFACRKQM